MQPEVTAVLPLHMEVKEGKLVTHWLYRHKNIVLSSLRSIQGKICQFLVHQHPVIQPSLIVYKIKLI